MRRGETRRPRLIAVLGVLLGACGPIEADHPLDPDTPADRQRPSRISGQLLPPGGPDPALFAGARAALWGAEAADAGVDPAYTSPVDAAGRFRFDAVRPGLYRFEAAAGELAADAIVLPVPAGQVLDLGAIPLDPRWGTLDGRVVDPAGAPVADAWARIGDHRADADADGRFRLLAPAGDRLLVAAAPGHAEAERAVVVEAHRTLTVEPLVLAPLPARVEGAVSLRRFETPARLAAVTVELLTGDAARATALVDGAYAFADVPAGLHTLVARAAGYDPVVRALRIAPGAAVRVDPIELTHASTGPDAVWLEATVGATGPLAGVPVDAHLDDLPFARAVSDRDGRVALPAAADDVYRLSVRTAGFAPAEIGPLTWDAEAGGFVDATGAAAHLELMPAP